MRTKFIKIALALILTGCGATKIPVEVEYAPNLNTTGIKRIAVMPFEGSGNYALAALSATSQTEKIIGGMENITLVDAAEINRLQNMGQSIEGKVDALLIGRITSANYNNEPPSSSSYKDKEGKIHWNTSCRTCTSVGYSYTLMRTKDGSFMGPISRIGTYCWTNFKNEPPDLFCHSSPDYSTAVAKAIFYIPRDLAPYKLKEERAFAEDKSGDSKIKDRMKKALSQVKEKKYELALDTYLGIYEQFKSVAAAENASIVYEVLGDTESALKIMQRAFEETNSPDAKPIIERLSEVLENKAKITESHKIEVEGK